MEDGFVLRLRRWRQVKSLRVGLPRIVHLPRLEELVPVLLQLLGLGGIGERVRVSSPPLLLGRLVFLGRIRKGIALISVAAASSSSAGIASVGSGGSGRGRTERPAPGRVLRD